MERLPHPLSDGRGKDRKKASVHLWPWSRRDRPSLWPQCQHERNHNTVTVSVTTHHSCRVSVPTHVRMFHFNQNDLSLATEHRNNSLLEYCFQSWWLLCVHCCLGHQLCERRGGLELQYHSSNTRGSKNNTMCLKAWSRNKPWSFNTKWCL